MGAEPVVTPRVTGRPELYVGACDYAAAKYAATHWHYSRTMPGGKRVYYGVWENRTEFVGAVMFGNGANRSLAEPFNLRQTQVCELVRVALREHAWPVTRILAVSLRLLKQQNPGLRVVVSYADPKYGHVGTIYQAGNWIYTGLSNETRPIVIAGKAFHPRSASGRYGTCSIPVLRSRGINASLGEKNPKHTYVYAFDKQMRRLVAQRAQEYPRHAAEAT